MNPYVVGVAELLRRPGTQRPVTVAGPLEGLAISTAAVPEGGEVVAEVVLESILDGAVTVTGVVRAPWVGECRRCLRPVEGTLEAEVREVYAGVPPDDEVYPLAGDRLDLEPMVRDAVLLSLPLAPLCDGGCQGPDPEHHPLTVATEDAPPADDRWAGLSELHFD